MLELLRQPSAMWVKSFVSSVFVSNFVSTTLLIIKITLGVIQSFAKLCGHVSVMDRTSRGRVFSDPFEFRTVGNSTQAMIRRCMTQDTLAIQRQLLSLCSHTVKSSSHFVALRIHLILPDEHQVTFASKRLNLWELSFHAFIHRPRAIYQAFHLLAHSLSCHIRATFLDSQLLKASLELSSLSQTSGSSTKLCPRDCWSSPVTSYSRLELQVTLFLLHEFLTCLDILFLCNQSIFFIQ